MAGVRKFSDVDLIQALNATGGNVTRAAELLGVSRLAVIRRRDGLPKGLLMDVDEFRRNKEKAFTELQQIIMQYVTPEKLRKSSAAQLMSMIGILEDKIRQIKGLPTEQIAHAHIHKLHPDDVKLIKQVIKQKTRRLVDAATDTIDVEADVKKLANKSNED